MKNLLISTLETTGFPVHLQGTLAPDEPLPESIITFWTNGTPEAAAFDNETALTAWDFQVTFYSSNPALVESVPRDIRNKLKAAGFVPQGKGHDIPADEPTHTGWTCNYLFFEQEEAFK